MTSSNLDQAAIADLLSDAKSSEEQAFSGPYYPEKGITRESLLAYAKRCREKAERYKEGGAHTAIISGE